MHANHALSDRLQILHFFVSKFHPIHSQCHHWHQSCIPLYALLRHKMMQTMSPKLRLIFNVMAKRHSNDDSGLVYENQNRRRLSCGIWSMKVDLAFFWYLWFKMFVRLWIRLELLCWWQRLENKINQLGLSGWPLKTRGKREFMLGWEPDFGLVAPGFGLAARVSD